MTASTSTSKEPNDQPSLFDEMKKAAEEAVILEESLKRLGVPQAPRFDGESYLPWRDDERLTQQYRRVFSLMADGKWRSLHEIATATGDPEASVSAQLRHARKDRFGRNTLDKDYRGEGLYYYRLLINPDAAAIMAACSKRIRTKAVQA